MIKGIIKIGLLSTLALVGVHNFSFASNTIQVEATHKKQTTKTFKVYGNCGMCEKKIEGALKGVKGIDKADWKKESKMIEVVYHTHDITLEEIKKKIAAVGYDMDDLKASDESYKGLPACCQYERPSDNEEEDHEEEEEDDDDK